MGALLRFALFGFPILVKDREAFHTHLARRGVRGLMCSDRWWFDTSRPPSELHRTHYLLPVNHHLSERDIRKVISAANAYIG